MCYKVIELLRQSAGVSIKEETDENNGAATGVVEFVPEELDVKDGDLQIFADVFARFTAPPEEVAVSVSVALYVVACGSEFFNATG